MKRNLLYAFLFLAIPSALVAQCDPQAHDWGSATFGVSPDPTLGENFAPATINVAYSDAVYVLCPSTVGDIDPTNAFAGLGIDSISLDSITIFNGLADVQLSNIGLNVTCNNNGESPNPCMFYPSHAYCGDIMGVPTVSGTFDVQIWVTAHATFFNSPLAVPYSFPGYTLVIAGPTAVIEESNYSLNLLQNTPNPANAATTIRFELSHAEDIHLM